MAFSTIIRPIAKLLIPSGIIFLSVLYLITHQAILSGYKGFISILPIGFLITGIILGWRFHRNRLIYGLFFFYLIQAEFLGTHVPSSDSSAWILGIAIPFNFLILILMPDRSFFSRKSLMFFSILLIQVCIFIALSQNKIWQDQISNLQDLPKLSLLFQNPINWILISLALCIFTISIRLLTKFNVFDIGVFWSIVTVHYGWFQRDDHIAVLLSFSAASLILIVSLLELSYRMAYNDELTGLPARRALNEKFKELGQKYCIVMADIDHFKKINDTYGHDTGDEVLRMIAALLYRTGSGGKAYRYGGEEFCIVFSGKSCPQVVPVIETLRKSINEKKFAIRTRRLALKKSSKAGQARRHGRGKKRSKSIAVTLSFGIAEKTNRMASPETVIKAADTALYQAKKTGRNKVCIS